METYAQAEHIVYNISFGGLACDSEFPIAPGARVKVKIPLPKLEFESVGRVVWCHHKDAHFEIGVEFMEMEEAYKVRMIEQICHIEHYRQDVLAREGRTLSSEQAAREWISRYAGAFPQLDEH